MKKNNGYRKYWKLIVLWLILISFVLASFIANFDKKITGAIILLYGLTTEIFGLAFGALISFCATLPWIGPFLVRIFLWPVTVVVNALAVSVGLIKVKQGNAKQVLGAKLGTMLLAVGILLGYILGKFI